MNLDIKAIWAKNVFDNWNHQCKLEIIDADHVQNKTSTIWNGPTDIKIEITDYDKNAE